MDIFIRILAFFVFFLNAVVLCTGLIDSKYEVDGIRIALTIFFFPTLLLSALLMGGF